jgi:acyl-CoA dehydrogenase
MRYTTRRKAFGVPIKDFQAVSFKVAESITELDAARALVFATASAIDSGKVPAGRLRRGTGLPEKPRMARVFTP